MAPIQTILNSISAFLTKTHLFYIISGAIWTRAHLGYQDSFDKRGHIKSQISFQTRHHAPARERGRKLLAERSRNF